MYCLGETRKILVACLITALALPALARAEQAGKGVSDSSTVEKRATITAIDPETRTVTLKGEKGEFPVEVGSEVANFNDLKVGDVVVATYTESIAVRMAAPGEATPAVSGTVSANPAGTGSPKVGQEVTASLKVEAVDLSANTVTLSGPSGEKRTVEVVDPKVRERLKTVKPGDVVVLTYTESLALRLEKVAK